ncbi:hypothetical protein Tco_0286419 [Tanacetum coccineum]
MMIKREDLQQCFELVTEEDVAIDAIPLATKPAPIVNFQIHRKGRNGYYEIMRADGSAKTYLLFSQLLKEFDREDLENLWKLVKAKHGNTRPEEGYERVLWGDLKTMFEHHIEDLIWRNLQGKKVLLWRLYDSCGVHFVRFEDMHVYMLVEKRYPLTPATITDMLNKKLKSDYWNEIMTKVIKGEFEKIKDVKVEDVPLTCDASLEVFNDDVSRLSKMDDELFTYEVEAANIPYDSKMDNDSEQEADDDMGYDPSDIYWIRGDDEVELTDEESSDDEDEIAEVFRIDTNIFDYETPLCSAFNEFNYLLKVDPDLLTKDIMGFKTYEDYKDDWIYEWNKDLPWVYDKPWLDNGIWKEPAPVKHSCKPFNYKTGCSEWPTCSWMDDGYCNGGNLPGTYIIGNQLHYQDLEWYEALEDSELKDEALRNKAIMEGFIKEDDDESRYKQMRRWNIYTNYDDAYEINHEDNESKELCEVHELPMCNIRKYMMIKYSFNNDEEYATVKEDEYDDLTITRKECWAYQEIFRIMDEGWMVTRAE